jgi:hypothetical protein
MAEAAEGRGYRRNQLRGALQSAPKQAGMTQTQAGASPAMATKLRDLEAARLYMNRLEGPDWYGTRTGGGVGSPEMRNLMAAGAIAGVPFQSGWDTYARLAGAAPAANPLAQTQAQAFQDASGFQGGGLSEDQVRRMYPGMHQRMYGAPQKGE